FRYDAERLIEVNRPRGAIRYGYGDDGRLTDVVDADGVPLVHNEYDAEGRGVAQTSPYGRGGRLRDVGPSTGLGCDDGGGAGDVVRRGQLRAAGRAPARGRQPLDKEFRRRGQPGGGGRFRPDRDSPGVRRARGLRARGAHGRRGAPLGPRWQGPADWTRRRAR